MFRRAALALLLVAPLAAADNQRQSSVTGRYTSNWDEVRLQQDGDRITGTYVCCGGGTIRGRVYEGRVIRYRWDQPGGTGRGVWTIQNGSLLGTWGSGQDDDDGGRWDLERTSSNHIAR